MKKRGILNSELIGNIARLGHMDLFMIGDAGMPIPSNVTVVDLALCTGVPTFQQVLDAMLDETVVEYYYLADEIEQCNPRLADYISHALEGIEHTAMSHEKLKELSAQCRFAVRTGECSPYPNLILRAGVSFS